MTDIIELIDAYAETRHRCGGRYNSRTETARKAVIEALSGVRALSAAPAGPWSLGEMTGNWRDIDLPDHGAVMRIVWKMEDDEGRNEELEAQAHAVVAALNAAFSTPPAEQQAKVNYIKLLADCRDAFPVPEHGSPIENEWIAAVGSHEAVPAYLQAVAKQQTITPETGNSVSAQGAAITSESGTPPAEQQAAPKAAPKSFLDGADVQDESGVLAYYSREAVLACITAALESVAAPKAAPGEPVHGDVLPPVGSRVYIRHGRDNDAHACTVTGYYAWGDLGGDKRLHRVFVRLVYEGTDIQQARMLCDCYPTAEAALAQAAPQQEAQEPDHSLRTDALCQLAYCNGMKAGWNYCVDGNEVDFARAMEGVSEAMKVLRELRENAPQPAPAPLSDEAVRDAAFEAVRKKLCALPRYSFVLDDDGLVRRVQDRTGNWIEFDAAHELFDPVAVDAALAAQGGK